MIDAGLPYHADMFSTGESPHGCGHVPRTVHQGIRSTAADFVTKGQRSEFITIKTGVTVDKILFTKPEDGEEPLATSVATLSKDGTPRIYTARHEIIITAGAYCSPPILMRSGIGPAAHLAEHNLPVLVDSPHVGQNLQDHLLVFQFYEVSEPGLTNDHLVYHDNAIASSYQLYVDKKEGVLSTFPFGIFGFVRVDERLKDDEEWKKAARESKFGEGRDPMGLTKQQPNLEFWNTELYGGPKQFADFPLDKKHAFAMCTLLFNPHSRGTVRLSSANALDNPKVDHGYLSDPQGLDMLVLSEGCAMANDFVMAGSGTKNVVKGAWPAELTHHKHTNRKDWEEHVRQHATTCYHASGTCGMGTVLDSRLRVKGVKGLRVADVSSIPRVNNGHTQMVAYGIGEGCAEIICEEAKAGSGAEFLKLVPEVHKMTV
jgi:choline dehydrogenase-like flavoprotein